MIVPVATVSLLLAMIADQSEVLPRKLYQLGDQEGWLPPPGALDDDPLRVPRLWFDTHPHLVPKPFSWHSDRAMPSAKHPYRTMHILMDVDDFIKAVNTSDWQMQSIAKFSEANYLPVAQSMVRGELEPDFPIPWLQIKRRKGHTEIWSHEGRHRALMAKQLGLKVLPVIILIPTGPEGYEHYRETIDSDPIVESFTRGSSVYVWSQDWGESRRPPQYMQIVPRTANGDELRRQLIRLRMTIDPQYRNRRR